MELSQTTIKDDKVYIGEVIMANFLVMSIKTYYFNRMGQKPEAIILPKFSTYEGIPIEYAEADDPYPDGPAIHVDGLPMTSDGTNIDELTPEELAEMEADMKHDAEVEAKRDAMDREKEIADTVDSEPNEAADQGEEEVSGQAEGS